jgi:hypothetical protein
MAEFNTDTVYVATLDLDYDLIAVARTRDRAIALVAEKGLYLLTQQNAVTKITDTGAKIVEYFGVRVTRLAMNTAVFAGQE